MKQITILALWLSVCVPLLATSISTNSVANRRTILIDRSSTGVAGGKATLSIGSLQRTGGVFAGEYEMKVSPYFFKSEKGKLAIIVSDESLAKIHRGIAATVTGTATTNGKGGTVRRIDAIATPADHEHGTLKLWFRAGEKKLVFNTSYRFARSEIKF